MIDSIITIANWAIIGVCVLALLYLAARIVTAAFYQSKRDFMISLFKRKGTDDNG